MLSLFDREFIKIGLIERDHFRAFHRLFSLRQKDAYDLIDNVPKEEAEEALALSENIVQAVHAYLVANGYFTPDFGDRS